MPPTSPRVKLTKVQERVLITGIVVYFGGMLVTAALVGDGPLWPYFTWTVLALAAWIGFCFWVAKGRDIVLLSLIILRPRPRGEQHS